MPTPVLIRFEATRLSEPELIDRTQAIAAKMALPANAARIAGLPYTAVQFLGLSDAYQNARQANINIKQDAKTSTQVKNAAELELEKAAMNIVRSLESRPALTAEDVLALGLDVRDAGSPPVIGTPNNLGATFGDVPGSISLHWDPLAGAVAFVVQYRVANQNGAWLNSSPFTGSTYQLPGLTPGELYEIRVCGIFAGQTAPGPACATIEHRAA